MNVKLVVYIVTTGLYRARMYSQALRATASWYSSAAVKTTTAIARCQCMPLADWPTSVAEQSEVGGQTVTYRQISTGTRSAALERFLCQVMFLPPPFVNTRFMTTALCFTILFAKTGFRAFLALCDGMLESISQEFS